jgi:cysteine-S-conjugate beta-lyase
MMMTATDFDDLDIRWLRSKQGVKWRRSAPGVLPAWVADMDFPVAPPIREALSDVVRRGDLCYPTWSTWAGHNPLAEPFVARMDERYGWRPRPEWLYNYSDLLQVLQIILHLTTERGDAVAIQTPSYPPFLKTIELMGRKSIAGPIERSEHGWEFDAQRLEQAIVSAGCKIMMIVNPHNPTGRVFTRAELQALADIALRNDMLILSDEVLADLAYQSYRHIPIASLGSEVADRTVTMTSATKAFNFAGLRCAVVHVGPALIRDALREYPPDFFGPVNVLGVEATKAAWQHGDAWLAGLLKHLDRNRHLVVKTLEARAPAIKADLPEAGYLAWLDCRDLRLAVEPADYFRANARVELSDGNHFGAEGIGFARLNFATSRQVLAEILNRMMDALATTPKATA